MANGEECSVKSSLSIGANMRDINFMIPSLRSGGLSWDMSNVVAVAERCGEEVNQAGIYDLVQMTTKTNDQQQKGSRAKPRRDP
jgi:hypothetical protein